MGGIQGFQLNTGFGGAVGGDQDRYFSFDLTAGLTIGLAGDPLVGVFGDDDAKLGYDLVQMPINFNAARWGESWNVGGDVALRFDLFFVNLDAGLELGAFVGEGVDASFALNPTFRVGFIKDLLGVKVSVAALPGDEFDAGRVSAVAYVNLAWIPSLFAGVFSIAREQMDSDGEGFVSANPSFEPNWSMPEIQPGTEGSSGYNCQRTVVNGQVSESCQTWGNPALPEGYAPPTPDPVPPQQPPAPSFGYQGAPSWGPPPQYQAPAPQYPPAPQYQAPAPQYPAPAPQYPPAPAAPAQADYSGCSERAAQNYDECARMVSACYAATSLPITLNLDKATVSFSTREQCVYSAATYASIGLKLR